MSCHRLLFIAFLLASEGLAEELENVPIATQKLGLGDAQILAEQPAALMLPLPALERLEAAVRELDSSTDASAPSPLTSLPALRLVWSAPGRAAETFVVAGPVVSLPVAAALSGTYRYHLEARSPGGMLSVRIPAGNLEFRIDAVVTTGPSVLEAPGDVEGVFGETISLKVRLVDPAGVDSVELRHRSGAELDWEATPMQLREGTPFQGLWKTKLNRPLGQNPSIEYHIVARNAAGRFTAIGSRQKPHRIVVRSPELPGGLGP